MHCPIDEDKPKCVNPADCLDVNSGRQGNCLDMKLRGIKADKEKKQRWDLFPIYIVAEATEIMQFGAIKYGEENWRKPMPRRRIRWYAAIMRHLFAYIFLNEHIDPESGKSHLAHILCNLMFLYETEKEEDENG